MLGVYLPMKQFFSKQLTNLVFLVLIVAAALTIYLLSRAGTAPVSASAAAGMATPSPSAMASERPAPRGIPETIFQAHLETSEQYTAKSSAANPRAWVLSCDKQPEIRSALLYDVQNDCVSSLELTFDLPKSYESDSKSAIEQYLYEASKQQSDVQADLIRLFLSDLFPVCDSENRLQAATVRYWAEQALLLDRSGEDYENTVEGCRFLAYLTERDSAKLLVCCLFFE
ncbi:hypothetical protein SDC9_119482 [bioreactor metagenome]|uniref:Uncharacterized protein n=1 Tax=bioreactor metagenome TaxID=1076179 RepID=A0A645C3X1_9ZZZZ